MKRNYYVSGDWNITCDVCSKKIKASESRLRWDGFVVCQVDYETRHPQDFVRARQDRISVPFQRPIPELLFTNVIYACTPEGSSGFTGIAVAGCAIAGHPLNGPYFSPTLAIAGIAVAGLSITGTS